MSVRRSELLPKGWQRTRAIGVEKVEGLTNLLLLLLGQRLLRLPGRPLHGRHAPRQLCGGAGAGEMKVEEKGWEGMAKRTVQGVWRTTNKSIRILE